jgi:hypothetical protein
VLSARFFSPVFKSAVQGSATKFSKRFEAKVNRARDKLSSERPNTGRFSRCHPSMMSRVAIGFEIALDI